MELGLRFLYNTYKLSRRRLQKLQTLNLIIMILTAFVILGFLHLYMGFDLNHQPIADTKSSLFNSGGYYYDDYDGSNNGYITKDSINEQMNLIIQLVNSKDNKQLFVNLHDGDHSFYDPISDTVGTIEFHHYNRYQSQPYVSNGYIGSRIPNVGQGFTYDQLSNNDNKEGEPEDESTKNGWPLFNKRYAGAFIAGFYDIQHNTTSTNFPELLKNGYESVIASVPQWTTLKISTIINGTEYLLDAKGDEETQGEISDYFQTLSMKNGIVVTAFTWLNTFRIKYEILAHRLELNLGLIKLHIHNLDDTSYSVKVIDSLDINDCERSQLFDTGYDDDDGIYMNFHPNDINYVYGSIYSRLKTNLNLASANVLNRGTTNSSHEITLTVNGKSSVAIDKYVGIVSSDLNPNDLKTKNDVLQLANSTVTSNFWKRSSDLVNSHVKEWSKIITSKVTFRDDLLLTMANRASMFHLAANTLPNAQGLIGALGVSGLSSDSYAGMVFWDTDLWMLNGLLPFLPDHTKSFVNYRLHTHEQAIKNIPKGYDGAIYPWTSGRFGNCTATGPCLDYEYHINMAVSFAAWQIYLSGNGDDNYLRDTVSLLINDAAEFMADYIKYNSTLDSYTTHNLTDPDEYANHVDNGAYTNAAASLLFKYNSAISNHLNKPIPDDYSHMIGNIHLPFSNTPDNITLEYSGMNSSIEVKQADVIMITYPLENEMITEEQAFVNMQFYAMKQVSFGPAMTFPIFSAVTASLAQSGCSSQSYLTKSVIPFIRAPFSQFLEQNNDDPLTNGGTHPAFPFLTAHGGLLQASLQGLTGLRFDYEINSDGKIERMLKLDPVELPMFNSGVAFEGIRYMNNSLSINVTKTQLEIHNLGPINDNNNHGIITIRVADRNLAAGKYKLKTNQRITIPLFKPKQSYSGSISECSMATFTNITESAYGDIPLMINDGDNFTHWQAKYHDSTAKVLVDLKQFKPITTGVLNWGDRPPTELTVSRFNLDNDWDSYELLSSVDFGAEMVSEKYRFFKPTKQVNVNQSDAFAELINEKIEITAPFNMKEFFQYKVELPDSFNLTTFNLPKPVSCRYLLLEFNGVHDPEPKDMTSTSFGGAKLFEAHFY